MQPMLKGKSKAPYKDHAIRELNMPGFEKFTKELTNSFNNKKRICEILN